MKTKNSLKKYGLRKAGLCLIACLFFLTMLEGCGSTANETTASGTASQTDISRKSNKPDSSPVPEEDTDIHPKSKKHGKISLSKDKKTIFVNGWLETHELTNRRTEKATKIVFRKDAGIIFDWDSDVIFIPHLQNAPLVKEVEVENGNPYLYAKDGMLIQRAGTGFDEDSETERNILIFCVPRKKGAVQIPETVQFVLDGAFIGCSGVTSIYLPASVEIVGFGAFGDMQSCTNIQADKKIRYIIQKKVYYTVNIHYQTEIVLLPIQQGSRIRYIIQHLKKPDTSVGVPFLAQHICRRSTCLPG